jgi:hypothetical protein
VKSTGVPSVRFIDSRVTRVLPQAWQEISARCSRWVSDPSGIAGPAIRPRRRPFVGADVVEAALTLV